LETPRQKTIKALGEALPQARGSDAIKIEFLSLDSDTLEKFAAIKGTQQKVRLPSRAAAVPGPIAATPWQPAGRR
jgi:hypothetical protein